MHLITISRLTILLHGLMICINNAHIRWALCGMMKCGAQNGAEREMEKTL